MFICEVRQPSASVCGWCSSENLNLQPCRAGYDAFLSASIVLDFNSDSYPSLTKLYSPLPASAAPTTRCSLHPFPIPKVKTFCLSFSPHCFFMDAMISSEFPTLPSVNKKILFYYIFPSTGIWKALHIGSRMLVPPKLAFICSIWSRASDCELSL